ncbi:MAG: hypothetical protein ACI87E_000178 [Mariniblastus sp.]
MAGPVFFHDFFAKVRECRHSIAVETLRMRWQLATIVQVGQDGETDSISGFGVLKLLESVDTCLVRPRTQISGLG